MIAEASNKVHLVRVKFTFPNELNSKHCEIMGTRTTRCSITSVEPPEYKLIYLNSSNSFLRKEDSFPVRRLSKLMIININ